MVRLRYVERDLSWQLLLQKRQTLEDRPVTSGDVDEEVVLIERLELDLDIGGLHDLVYLAILLAADELTVLVGKLNLEAYLVVESLQSSSAHIR